MSESKPKKNKRVTFGTTMLVREISNEFAKMDNLANSQTEVEYEKARRETRADHVNKRAKEKNAEKRDKKYPNVVVTPFASAPSVIVASKRTRPNKGDYMDFQSSVADYRDEVKAKRKDGSRSTQSSGKRGGKSRQTRKRRSYKRRKLP